jgi:hypothetical protein
MPSRNTRILISAWILFWALMIAVQLQEYVSSGGTHYWQPVVWETSSALVVTIFMLAQRRLTRRYDYLLGNPPRWFALQMMWLPLYWVCFTPVIYAIRHGVFALLGADYVHPPWPQVFIYEAVRLSLFFTILIVILFGVLSYQELLRKKEQALVSDQLLREAQLHRLTQQIQPHFLFNALNTISQLMHADIEKADATLVQLADVLRSTLKISEKHETTLAAELDMARAYAHLMCERFAERVDVVWNIDPGTLDCKVPAMSIQPLIENIFKHTVERRRGKARIVVVSSLVAGELRVRLDDDLGELAQNDEQGIGLGNLRTRLQTLHGERAGLTLSQLTPAGVRAEMRLPCGC